MTKNQGLAIASMFNGACWGGMSKLFLAPESTLPGYIFLGATALSFGILFALTYRPDGDGDDGPHM